MAALMTVAAGVLAAILRPVLMAPAGVSVDRSAAEEEAAEEAVTAVSQPAQPKAAKAVLEDLGAEAARLASMAAPGRSFQVP